MIPIATRTAFLLSAIAVLITSNDNWKIRACRTAYQILLVTGFLALRYAGVALDQAFAFAILGSNRPATIAKTMAAMTTSPVLKIM